MLSSIVRRSRHRFVSAVLAAALASAAVAVDAATFRWAGRGDMQTTDPHSQNENLTNNINSLIYEFLLARDKKLGLVPALAESWTQVNPTTWRFKLRPGVKFHDGTPFTADDVVFSFERARADTSQLRVYANASGIPKKIDDLTVEFTTNGPNPVELEHIQTINIMSKAWCEKNRATKPQNFTQKEEMITARQANGTGPYMLKSREPDVKTVLTKNPNWWGIKAGRWEGNADEVIYTPIVSDATRVAALISGEVDLVNDPPPQDVPRLTQTPGIKILEGAENRIVFIGMDQFRDELLYSNVKGKNPFKDKRVREALYYAVDIEAIKKNTMRGLSAPSGAMLPSPLQTTSEIEKRLPYDRERAKKLLAEAGYPNGFEVTLDCPNNRYINDEKICQALAAMWSQVGVNTKVNTMPRAVYFPKLEKNDTSMYMLGWGGGTTDAIFILQPVLATKNGKGRRRLQLRPLHQSQARRVAGEDQGQRERRTAAGRDPRGAAGAQRGNQPHSAAPPGDPVGRARQCDGRAPRRQPGDTVLGDTVASERQRPGDVACRPPTPRPRVTAAPTANSTQAPLRSLQRRLAGRLEQRPGGQERRDGAQVVAQHPPQQRKAHEPLDDAAQRRGLRLAAADQHGDARDQHQQKRRHPGSHRPVARAAFEQEQNEQRRRRMHLPVRSGRSARRRRATPASPVSAPATRVPRAAPACRKSPPIRRRSAPRRHRPPTPAAESPGVRVRPTAHTTPRRQPAAPGAPPPATRQTGRRRLRWPAAKPRAPPCAIATRPPARHWPGRWRHRRRSARRR